MNRTACSIVLLAAFGWVQPLQAAKVLLHKPMTFTDGGSFVGHQAFDDSVIETLSFTPTADYPTFVAGEVAEVDLAEFEATARTLLVDYEIRREFDVVKVNGYEFSSEGDGPELPAELRLQAYEGGVGLFLVQFRAPALDIWLEELRSLGEIIAYYPWNTFLMRVGDSEIAQIRRMANVQHVSLFQPAYKMQRSLTEADRPLDLTVRFDGSRQLDTVEHYLEQLLDLSIEIRGRSVRKTAQMALSRDQVIEAARRSEVLWIEPVFAVVLSGERQAMITAGQHNGSRPDDPEPGASHDGYEQWLIDKGFCTPSDATTGCFPYWTKVGVFDSGLNTMVCSSVDYNPLTGECSSWGTNEEHPDLVHASNLQSACTGLSSQCYGNVLHKFFCANDTNGNNDCLTSGEYVFTDQAGTLGHGTATSSIISSNPATNPIQKDDADYFRGTGLAPSAQLIISKIPSIYQGGGGITDGMSEYQYEDLVALVEGTGARFASNSWNLNWNLDWHDPNSTATLSATGYTGFSQIVDSLVRDGSGAFDGYSDPISIIFSAGNYILDGSGNPVDNLGTWVTSPGNAKNALVVGAHRGWSTTGAAGAAHDDCPNQNHDITAVAGGEDYNTANYDWHSRRMYPGDDDSGNRHPRYKPDLVAPGTQIAAARKQTSSSTDYYQCFSGTSSATPALAASAILADAWYYYVISSGTAVPSPAMVKAMLIAHADDLYGGTDPLTNETLPHSPSPAQGWGRVNLDALFQEDTEVSVYDEDHTPSSPTRRFTSTGQYWTDEFQVDDSSKPIIAVLVYTDAASSTSESDSLVVNDLTLTITRPGSFRDQRTWFGNSFASGSWYSQAYLIPVASARDFFNNVEVIRIDGDGLTVPFTLKVTASAINAKAVPDLDGASSNQDFALYLYNASPTS